MFLADIGRALANAGPALFVSVAAAILAAIASGSFVSVRAGGKWSWQWRLKRADEQRQEFVDQRITQIKTTAGVTLSALDEQLARISLEQEWFMKKQVQSGVMGLIKTGGTFVSIAAGGVGVYTFIDGLIRVGPK